MTLGEEEVIAGQSHPDTPTAITAEQREWQISSFYILKKKIV